jgi:biotin operon repressor
VSDKIKDRIKKGLDILRASEGYTPAKDLAEKLGIPLSGVFKIIRLLRRDNIGVHTTPKGYVLSEYAKKTDDVHFLRRMNGRRTSDFIAMRAAEPEIRKRWSAVADKRDLSLITAPLRVELDTLLTGSKTLLSCAERFAPTLKK